MLKSLHIENIAVIEKTDIELSSGLNVLTGETGTGKSIVIDAINAVLGDRTSKDLIRRGFETAEVSALFCNVSDTAKTILEENGFSADEDGNLLVMRRLSLSGNGSVRINGKPATVGLLKSVSNSLVNIHGQHDSQNLLNPDNHIHYVDKIAENASLIKEYYNEFKHLNAVRKELSSIETDEEEKQRKTDLLKYQINEIESANIKIGEREEIKEKIAVADNFEKTLSSLKSSYSLLNGGDDSDGALSLIRNAQKDVSDIKIEGADGIRQKFFDILVLLEDVSADLRDAVFNSEFGEQDPEKLRSRLETIHSLSMKYGKTEEEILNFCEKAKEELNNIVLSDERIKTLSAELDKSTERLIILGDKLTDSRKKAAALFSQKVTENLQFLNMPNVKFEVKIGKGKYTRIGCDVVEFFILTNVGESMKPLHKIASGGELSRIMLAIKNVLADKDDIDTLIFDEIDTGISGVSAGKVGIKLKESAISRQVICVTHLAQIAACADTHFLIEKTVKGDRTYTQVSPLDYEHRINELARIMAGSDITSNLYFSAKEMIDRSSKK